MLSASSDQIKSLSLHLSHMSIIYLFVCLFNFIIFFRNYFQGGSCVVFPQQAVCVTVKQREHFQSYPKVPKEYLTGTFGPVTWTKSKTYKTEKDIWHHKTKANLIQKLIKIEKLKSKCINSIYSRIEKLHMGFRVKFHARQTMIHLWIFPDCECRGLWVANRVYTCGCFPTECRGLWVARGLLTCLVLKCFFDWWRDC